MTMALSAPLQRGLYAQIAAAPELAQLAGRIFDDAPHAAQDAGEGAYVTLGDETVTPWSTATEQGAAHVVTIRVYAPVRGFLSVKETAASLVRILAAAPPVLSRGAVVTHQFVRSETRREEGGALRRIDLVFRFVIEDEA